MLLIPAAVSSAFAADRYEVWFTRSVAAAAAVFVIYSVRKLLSNRWARDIFAVIFGSFYWLVSILESSSFFMSGVSFDRKYFYHFNFNSIRYAPRQLQLGAFALFLCCVLGVLAVAVLFLRKKHSPVKKRSKRLIFSILFAASAVFFICASPLSGIFNLMWNLNNSRMTTPPPPLPPDRYLRFGIKKCPVERDEITAEAKGKNLIFILLESVESTFLDEKIFPGLMPNLQRLVREEALYFNDVKAPRNAEFTFGAMYAMFFGSILCPSQLIGAGNLGNDGLNVAVGNRLSSFPLILNRAGYKQSFMRGPPIEFGGTNVLLKNEGYDEMWSAEPDNGNLLGWESDKWGCFDDELFERAFKKYQELCQTGKPFNLTLLTVNGHNPRGFCPPDAPHYTGWKKVVPLLDANAATDRALGRFIERLKQTPEWKNTIVVFCTDHPALHCTISDVLYANPHRKLVFGVLNSRFGTGIINRTGRSFDLAPTVLELLEVKHNYTFPLGESLLHETDPRRLKADEGEGLETLGNYVKQRSWIGLGNDFTAEINASGRPVMTIGKLELPIFARNWGVQRLPQERECFIVRLTPGNEIIDYGTEEPQDMEKFRAGENSYLIFGTGKSILPVLLGVKNYEKEEFFLAFCRKRKWKYVSSLNPHQLKLDTKEEN